MSVFCLLEAMNTETAVLEFCDDTKTSALDGLENDEERMSALREAITDVMEKLSPNLVMLIQHVLPSFSYEEVSTKCFIRIDGFWGLTSEAILKIASQGSEHGDSSSESEGDSEGGPSFEIKGSLGEGGSKNVARDVKNFIRHVPELTSLLGAYLDENLIKLIVVADKGDVGPFLLGPYIPSSGRKKSNSVSLFSTLMNALDSANEILSKIGSNIFVAVRVASAVDRGLIINTVSCGIGKNLTPLYALTKFTPLIRDDEETALLLRIFHASMRYGDYKPNGVAVAFFKGEKIVPQSLKGIMATRQYIQFATSLPSYPDLGKALAVAISRSSKKITLASGWEGEIQLDKTIKWSFKSALDWKVATQEEIRHLTYPVSVGQKVDVSGDLKVVEKESIPEDSFPCVVKGKLAWFSREVACELIPYEVAKPFLDGTYTTIVNSPKVTDDWLELVDKARKRHDEKKLESERSKLEEKKLTSGLVERARLDIKRSELDRNSLNDKQEPNSSMRSVRVPSALSKHSQPDDDDQKGDSPWG